MHISSAAKGAEYVLVETESFDGLQVFIFKN
jgi:hypothetical protein